MNRFLILKRLCSSSLPKNIVKESAKQFQKIEVTPVALQYLYEDLPNIQTEALKGIV